MSVSSLEQPIVESQTWSGLYANSLSVASLSSESTSLTGNLDMKNHDILNIQNILQNSFTPTIEVISGGSIESAFGNYYQVNNNFFLQFQYVVNLSGGGNAVSVIIARPSGWHAVNDIFSVNAYNGGAGGFMIVTAATSLVPTLTYVMERTDGSNFNAGNCTFTLNWSYN